MNLKWLKKDKRIGYSEWPAYLLDIYRVFPRVLFGSATYAVAMVWWWYMYGLLSVERTAEVTAFVSVVTGAWAKALDYYMQRGVDWSKRMNINGGESGVTTTTTTESK